jgi:hypothetical protein
MRQQETLSAAAVFGQIHAYNSNTATVARFRSFAPQTPGSVFMTPAVGPAPSFGHSAVNALAASCFVGRVADHLVRDGPQLFSRKG